MTYWNLSSQNSLVARGRSFDSPSSATPSLSVQIGATGTTTSKPGQTFDLGLSSSRYRFAPQVSEDASAGPEAKVEKAA